MKKENSVKIRSGINNSEAFGAIMDKFNLLGQSMAVRAFYREYVKPLDPNITYRMWDHYVRRLRKHVTLRSEEITNKVADTLISENTLENSSLRKILAISDLSLDNIIADPALLEVVPIEKRIDWLFSAMKARDSRMIAVAKIQGEKRKTSMYEDMIQAAQYGAIEPSDVSDSKDYQEQPEPAPRKKLAPKKPASTQVIEFSPANFEKEQYAEG